MEKFGILVIVLLSVLFDIQRRLYHDRTFRSFHFLAPQRKFDIWWVDFKHFQIKTCLIFTLKCQKCKCDTIKAISDNKKYSPFVFAARCTAMNTCSEKISISIQVKVSKCSCFDNGVEKWRIKSLISTNIVCYVSRDSVRFYIYSNQCK